MAFAPDSEWWKKASDVIKSFHKEKAAIPSNTQSAREDLKENIGFLRTYLEFNYNLCDKIIYSGSAFENLNISGEKIEFDVMFIAQRSNFLHLTECNNGYCKIQCNNPMLNYQFDDDLHLDAKRFRNFFKGRIQAWSNLMKTHKNKRFTVIEHGVAVQINVLNGNGEFWYQVDLVPCFEVRLNALSEEKCYCVPKPPNDDQNLIWRISYSVCERDLASKIHADVKMCIRVVKALFKLETDGLFKKFTSYHIKTAAFHYWGENITSPIEDNLGRNVFNFLIYIKESLQKADLRHYFDRSINLLDKAEMNPQLATTINGWVKSGTRFLDIFSLSPENSSLSQATTSLPVEASQPVKVSLQIEPSLKLMQLE